MGAERPATAERSGWVSAGLATSIMTILAVVFMVLPEAIMGFFTDDREVIALGRSFFVIVALAEPIMAFSFSMGGALRGGGDPISPFVYASVSDLVIVIAVGYLLAVVLGWGFPGVAAGIAISALTRALPTTLRFRAGKWKSIAI